MKTCFLFKKNNNKKISFHPLMSLEGEDTCESLICAVNYAKLSDKGLAGTKTPQIEIEKYPIHRNNL